MATLEDKLLGEKLDYYCSSSEDEDEGQIKLIKEEELQQTPSLSGGRWNPGAESTNTGPKGVLKDWQRYKQLEAERRAEDESERLALIKRLSLTCHSSADAADTTEHGQSAQDSNPEGDDELDEMMLEYIAQRMQEMVAAAQGANETDSRPRFGKLIVLRDRQAFLDAIDKEHPQTTVFVHIYAQQQQAGTREASAADTLNACLNTLAEEYPLYKFCVMSTETAGMTAFFEKNGVPALIIYRGGNLIGNFVRLSDEFGSGCENFVSTDVEEFLVEHGFLPDPSTVPKIAAKTIRNGAALQHTKKEATREEDDDDD